MVKFVHKSKDFFLFCLALDTDLEIFPLRLFLLCILRLVPTLRVQVCWRRQTGRVFSCCPPSVVLELRRG